MEKLARNMMVSKDAAWEMKKATDALGESINDIAITPELMERYQKLIADGKNMKVGGDFAQTMRSFRDLMFEFTRLKQEVSYAMTWVGYYLLKYLNRPLSEAQAKFRSFNDAFIRNMSTWTEKAARALVYIINIGLHFATFIKELTTNIYDMWMAFPRGIKIATAAVTAFFALIKMSPMGRMITVVSTLLLLLDDYFGYFEGKDALFGKYWERLRYFIEMGKEKSSNLLMQLNQSLTRLSSMSRKAQMPWRTWECGFLVSPTKSVILWPLKSFARPLNAWAELCTAWLMASLTSLSVISVHWKTRFRTTKAGSDSQKSWTPYTTSF